LTGFQVAACWSLALQLLVTRSRNRSLVVEQWTRALEAEWVGWETLEQRLQDGKLVGEMTDQGSSEKSRFVRLGLLELPVQGTHSWKRSRIAGTQRGALDVESVV